MPSRGIYRPGKWVGPPDLLRRVGVTKSKSFQGIPLHQFGEGGEGMYATTQTSEDISMGDLLEVPGERMAGFQYSAWPVAVTKATAGMHEIAEGGPQRASYDSPGEHERYVRSYGAAQALKAKRGYD